VSTHSILHCSSTLRAHAFARLTQRMMIRVRAPYPGSSCAQSSTWRTRRVNIFRLVRLQNRSVYLQPVIGAGRNFLGNENERSIELESLEREGTIVARSGFPGMDLPDQGDAAMMVLNADHWRSPCMQVDCQTSLDSLRPAMVTSGRRGTWLCVEPCSDRNEA
jgi:hypothetical protein